MSIRKLHVTGRTHHGNKRCDNGRSISGAVMNKKLLARRSLQKSGQRAVGLVWACVACLPVLASQDQNQTAIVGEATMVIGVARVVGSTGLVMPADKGMAIRVGDRIETGAGGHVHLRFVDGGRVSVRPASRLQIESYAHSSEKPALNAIKFRLDEGVVRSITGSWGEAARDRFRLNTPMAAIGVKGTDFIVNSGAGSTSVSVYAGAVLMAPLAEGCQATLGPCLNGRERLLSGDMKGQMLELSRQHATAQLVPVEDLAAGQARRAVVMAGDTSRAGKTLSADSAPYGDIGADKAAVSESRGAMVASNFAPAHASQLVWGRWAQPWEGDTFSQSFQEARLNRESTVGNGVYGLFREPASLSASSPAQTEGSASFRLTSGVATLRPEGLAQSLAQSVSVDGGTLSVDFSRATFATRLSVSSAVLGTESVSANGVLLSSGVFQSRGGDSFVAGALSNDRREAGYFFEKTLPAGGLTGITLWGR